MVEEKSYSSFVRVALFGGTFDPPHRGHLDAAAAAADAFHLDLVLFAPVGLQPLKPDVHSTPFADRLAMTQLACAVDARFIPSLLDAPRADGQPNYTVNTLTALRTEFPGAALFNLVGADSFLDLPRWREPSRLLELAEWIVVSRPGFPLDAFSKLGLTPGQQEQVHLLETVHQEISATHLRERLREGDDSGGLIPAAVVKYIRAHRLYR